MTFAIQLSCWQTHLMRRFLVLTILDLALLVVKCLYMGQGGLYILPSTEVTHLFVQGVVLLYQTMHIDITMLFVACQIVNIKSNLILFFCFSQFVCSFLLYFFVVLLSLNEAFYIFSAARMLLTLIMFASHFATSAILWKREEMLMDLWSLHFAGACFTKTIHPNPRRTTFFLPLV